MRIAKWGLVILLISPLGVASAQQQPPPPSDQPAASGQQESLADAARRAQEQKKDQPKAAKVWDNDSIPSAPANISVVGQSGGSDNPAAAGNQPAKPAETGQQGNPAATPEKKADVEGQIIAAKDLLASLKNDLDIAQRKYSLDQQTYYGKTGYASDKEGTAALADEKSEIDAKQQEIADAQKKLDDLQAQLNAAGSKDSK